MKKCVEFADHRIKVIAGTGSNCTATAIYLSTEAESYGVDGLLVVTPYYNKATQKGLIAHFTAVANSVNVPIILYNVPSRTGCNIQPETAVYLAQNVENIVGIKEASGNISQVVKLIIPEDVHDMVQKYLDGDVQGSLDLQLKAIDLCNALFCEVNPIPVKKAVELLGMCDGTMRMPLTEMEPQNVEKLKKAMEEYGVL